MKRQRSGQGCGAPSTTKKKATKRVVEKVKEEAVGVAAEEEERRDGEQWNEGGAREEAWMNWDEWPRPCCWSPVVDEQMPWGTFWCPFWDLESAGEAHIYNALYGDVAWEDDIWDLKRIKEIPKS